MQDLFKMPYVVNIQTGSRSGKNFTRMQSTPLSNKEKVRAWIKRNPVGNAKTKITIKNLLTKKTLTTTKGRGSFYGRNIVKEIEEHNKKTSERNQLISRMGVIRRRRN